MANIKQIKAQQQGKTYSPLSSNSYAGQKSAGPQPVLSPKKTNGGSPGSTKATPPAPTINPNITNPYQGDIEPLVVTTESSLSDLIGAWISKNWMWLLLIIIVLMMIMRKGNKSMPFTGN